jgi:hypothetical protein
MRAFCSVTLWNVSIARDQFYNIAFKQISEDDKRLEKEGKKVS